MSVKEIVEATGGRLLSGPPDVTFPRLFTDSREVESGGLFVALRGGQHDGHVFIPQAVERGAAGVLCERPPQGTNGAAVILVGDTRQALLDLTAERLRRRLLPIVAVTGSAGKTTTKELIAHLLGRRQRVHKSEGNLNTYTGIPMTVFQMDPRDRVLVVEYAMSRTGEIRELTSVAPPTIGVVLNVGLAHVGLLGSIEAVAVASALHGFIPPSRRMNILTGRNGATVIDDSYNASPGSMQAALEVLRLAPRGSLRVAVLGDMLELGDHAEQAHDEIGSLAGKTADILIAVGEYAPRMVQSARRAGLAAERALVVEGADEAVAALTPWLNAQTQVLVKGSRGMRLERVVEQIGEPA